MGKTVFQEKFNHSVVTALLFSTLSEDDKETKLQSFINEAEERYDLFCDNILQMLANKNTSQETNVLYLTIDGFSFASNATLEQQPSCVPVLTVNQYSPHCPDILAYIEIALCHYSTYCRFAKSALRSLKEYS